MSERTKGEVIYDQVAVNAIDIASKESSATIAQVISEEDELGNLEIANAKRLVLCWNCHDDLVAACEFASEPEAPFSTDKLEFANRIIKAINEKAIAALDKAKGEK